MTELLDETEDDDAVETSAGRILSVTAEGVGTNLTADAASGATLLEVDDAAVFDEIGGGSLRLADTLYTYATGAVDTLAETVTLDSALVADASEGDRVEVWDAVNASVVRVWRAQVAQPGPVANDDPIEAVISQALTVQIAEGTRDLGPGESVTMELRGTRWVIVDAPGKEAQILVSSAASMPIVVLNLSTTDAAANDDAIDAAIASFDGRNGTIYAPACPPVGTGFGVWPIAAAHDFLECDLIGAGAWLYSGAEPPDEGYPATIFYCTTQDAQFEFSGAGNMTGGFQLNGGAVALQPFKRAITHGGGDTGRVFQNVFVLNNAPNPNAGFQAGIINTWGSLTSLTVTVTNDAGTESTSALTMRGTTAADLQAAVEALANVGAGNFEASSRDLVDGTSVGGGPYEFRFLGDVSGSTLSVAFTFTGFSAGAEVISPRNADNALVYISSYLDTFINFATAQAAEHGMYLDGTFNCTFVNFTADFAHGDAIVMHSCGLLKFISGDIEVPFGSMIYAENSDVQIDNMSFYQIWSANSPFLIFANCDDMGVQLSNIFMRGIGGPYASPGAPGVYLEGGSAVQLAGTLQLSNFPGVLAVIADDFSIFDYKAFDPATIDFGPPALSFVNGAVEAQSRARFQTGIVAAGPVGLPSYATADRPTVAAAGSMVWDSDLTLPIFSDGAGGWVDATGASV